MVRITFIWNDLGGETALHLAAGEGRMEVLQFLINGPLKSLINQKNW